MTLRGSARCQPETGSISIEVMQPRDPKDMPPDVLHRLRALAHGFSGLELLVLFGSRSRADTHLGSDWDFAFRGAPSLEVELLIADLAGALSTDHVDLVDLDRAGGLLRYRVARDGSPVYEKHPHAFEQFWLDAVSFWCDARHVLELSYDAILARVSR